MKKSTFLFVMVILPLSICKIVLAACPSGQTVDQATGHCIKIQSSCSGKCTYYYDTTTHDVRFEKNADVPDGEEVVIPADIYRGGITGYQPTDEGRTVRNVMIGEGITGMGKWAFATYGGYHMGDSDGTLTLPSTFKSDPDNRGGYGNEFWNVSFGTIDVSAVKNENLYFASDAASTAVRTIILDPNSNTSVGIGGAYNEQNSDYTVNIICKGNKTKCDEKVRVGSKITKGTISYYEGEDGNGNWEVWSDDGKAIYADSSMQKLLSKYDFDGNQTGFYEYDRGGNLVKAIENGVEIYRRRIYTPAEATAAVSGKNTFKLKYR